MEIISGRLFACLPDCLRAGLQLTEHQQQSGGTTRGFHAAGWKPLSVSFVLHQPIGLRRAAFRFSRQTALGFMPWRPRGICHKFATVTVSQSLKANEHLSREAWAFRWHRNHFQAPKSFKVRFKKCYVICNLTKKSCLCMFSVKEWGGRAVC